MAAGKRNRRRREWLMEAQFGACCLCHKTMQTTDHTRDDYASLEHLLPRRSANGRRRKSMKKHALCNSPFILLSHVRCNQARGIEPVGADLLQFANLMTREFIAYERALGFIYDLAPADYPLPINKAA